MSGIHFPGVELSIDPTAGQWIRGELKPRHPSRRETLASQIVPSRFATYARIFHPAGSHRGNLAWQEVAARTGRTVHSAMQWKKISRPPQDRTPSAADGPSPLKPPEEGNLGRERAAGLANLLREFTATPDATWFAIWEGYGMLHGDAPQLLLKRGWWRRFLAERRAARRRRSLHDGFAAIPKLHCEYRSYLVYRGPLEAVTAFDDGTRPVSYQSPNLWWPDDRAWCVATEIDFDSTLIGGSRVAIDAVLASPWLEAMEISPQTRLDSRADRINAG